MLVVLRMAGGAAAKSKRSLLLPNIFGRERKHDREIRLVIVG